MSLLEKAQISSSEWNADIINVIGVTCCVPIGKMYKNV